MFAATPEGGGVHCVISVAGTNPIVWGPRADFVMDVGFSTAQVISEPGRVIIGDPDKTARFYGLSRPEGTYALYTDLDSSSLAKVPTADGKLEDISFLRRHDEALYHPAGTQLAVIGETEEGIYGVWAASNEGKKSHLLVPHRDEDEFYGLSFSADGETLHYMDDQHDSWELRAANLNTLKEGIALPESTLLLKNDQPLSIIASPFTNDLLTYREGTCDVGFTTFVLEGSTPRKVLGDAGDTQPIGWLPDDRLVVASTEDLCNPERTLDIHVVDEERSVLIVEDVREAAVRAELPAAPDPVSGPIGTSPE